MAYVNNSHSHYWDSITIAPSPANHYNYGINNDDAIVAFIQNFAVKNNLKINSETIRIDYSTMSVSFIDCSGNKYTMDYHGNILKVEEEKSATNLITSNKQHDDNIRKLYWDKRNKNIEVW